MAKGVTLPEDFLRIGSPAASRKSVLSAILETFSGDDTVRGVGATSAPLTEEARIAALSTRLEIPPEDFGVNLAGVRQPAPPRPAEITDEQQAAQDFEGFYEWTDEKGVKHATNKPETIPEGAKVKYLPFEKPRLGVGGAKLFGEATPEAIEMLMKAGETDQQREDRIIREIAEETGKSRAEAAKAFRESKAEITGAPTAPETFEEKTALRNKIVQNTQRLLKQNPEARDEILKQAGQLMRLRGVATLKKPEQTISTEIEGQKVEIPVAKYDPKKHGKGAASGDIAVSTVVTNFEAVTGAKKKNRGKPVYTEKFFKWRKDLAGTKEASIDDDIYKAFFAAVKEDPDIDRKPKNGGLSEWELREAALRGTAARIKEGRAPTVRGVGGATVVSPTVSLAGKAERRVLPDGRVLVKDAKGNITVEG